MSINLIWNGISLNFFTSQENKNFEVFFELLRNGFIIFGSTEIVWDVQSTFTREPCFSN